LAAFSFLLWSGLPGQEAHAAEAGAVVINEIMYHPPGDREELQYVELHNRGQSPVSLAGWSFAKGIEFAAPAGVALPAGGHGVICRDPKAFADHYGSEAVVIGVFKGKLSHNGEKLELLDAKKAVVDSVKYADQAPWPAGPDGYAASLERICPGEPGDDPANWAASKLPLFKRAQGSPGRQNDSYSAKPLPRISGVDFGKPAAGRETIVSATVADATGVKSVALAWWATAGQANATWTEVAMNRVAGDAKQGTYRGVIPAQAADRIVRFTVRAENDNGAARLSPGVNEPRPGYSFHTFANTNQNKAPVMLVFTLGYREAQGAVSRGGRGGRDEEQSSFARGVSAVVYLPPNGGETQLFDYMQVRPRKAGFKARFHKDRPLNGMTGVNVIYEAPRSTLSEPLAFALYRMSGVPAPLTEHPRVWIDGKPRGYQLLMEQPNKSFLRRNERSEEGNLYKLLWYENGVVRQHEKKTNQRTGHTDIVNAVNGLNRAGSAAAQWQFIQDNFNVEECINYYAVNMCIQNWDGFFNNYYVYRDVAPGGKWEIYPWDEDKTWGEYDGGSSNYDWYDMPLTFGMNGEKAGGGGGIAGLLGRQFGGGPFGGGNGWWRPPGWFSGPLLANPEFRKRFLVRLREICETVFIPEKMNPVINSLEDRLKAEVTYRAQLRREDPAQALARLQHEIQSFRNQVVNRRKFILKEIIAGAK
jgi:hypothetical protein